MPKVVDFGTCNEGKDVYTLLQWIEGVEVQDVLSSMNREESYELGKKSGSILRKIHTITVPILLSLMKDWKHLSMKTLILLEMKLFWTILTKSISAYKTSFMLSSRGLPYGKYDLFT